MYPAGAALIKIVPAPSNTTAGVSEVEVNLIDGLPDDIALRSKSRESAIVVPLSVMPESLRVLAVAALGTTLAVSPDTAPAELGAT